MSLTAQVPHTPKAAAPRRGRRVNTPPASAAERTAAGMQARKTVPVGDLANVPEPGNRTGAVAILAQHDDARVAELRPIRYGRMMVSPFTFYRGAAAVMAADLAQTPHSDLTVQLCGDAHLSNFGMFASPERRLVFDINDFDETLPGPFEWDVKRLAVSVAIVARELGVSRKKRHRMIAATAARYRTAMTEFAAMPELAVWYSGLDTRDMMREIQSMLDTKRAKQLARTLDRARTRDSVQVVSKLTETVAGQRRITADPPLIVPLRDLLPAAGDIDLEDRLQSLVRQYRRTLQPDRRNLSEHYRFEDMARKVVGVGSVGTRCWIVLLTGRDQNDVLVLQIKEAWDSVLAPYAGASEYANQGQRVVNGQRLMQQTSDIFLGWHRTAGIDEIRRDYYIRQFRDWKMSIEVESLLPQGLAYYAGQCAWSLARAHARSGDRFAIAGYLGEPSAFDAAIAEFADVYADLNERDHAQLVDAAAAGTVVAQNL
jgi:uncharacterized protein (DUF2252 family)